MRFLSHLKIGSIYFFLTFLFSNSTLSNTRVTIDSLQQVISTSDNDSVKSELFSKLAQKYAVISTDSALLYALDSKFFAEKNKSDYLSAKANIAMGDIYRLMGLFEQADSSLNLALTSCLENDYKETLSSVYNLLGILRKNSGNYEQAIEYYLRGLEIDDQLNNPTLKAMKYMNIGVVYSLTNDLLRSEIALKKSLKIIRNIDNKAKEALIYNNLGIIYFKTHRYDSAMFFWWENALVIYNALGLDSDLADIYSNMAIYYRHNENFQGAIKMNQQSLLLREKIGDPKRIAFSKMNIGNDYASLGNLTLSLKFLNEGLEIADTLQDMTLMQYVLADISEAYALNNHHKQAYDYQIKYTNLKDSLLTAENKSRMDELLIKYETEKKDRQILEQEVSIASQDEKVVRQRFLLITSISVSVLLLLLIGLLFVYLRQRKKLYKQQLDTVLKEKELSNVNFLLKGEEQERSRLAKELHDGVNGSLGLIKLMASKELKDSEKTKNKNLLEINTMLDSVSDEVREISHNLMPDILIQLGLNEALKSHLSRVKQANTLDLDFQTYGDLSSVNSSVSLAVFRIVQELVRNILKHANASECLVQINQNNTQLGLVVEDNGKGFDVSGKTRTNNRGIGIQSVQSRVELLGGTLDIQSNLGIGTSININLPTQN